MAFSEAVFLNVMPLARSEGRSSCHGPGTIVSERDIVVYWYSFSNPRTVCIHYGFSLVEVNPAGGRSHRGTVCQRTWRTSHITGTRPPVPAWIMVVLSLMGPSAFASGCRLRRGIPASCLVPLAPLQRLKQFVFLSCPLGPS